MDKIKKWLLILFVCFSVQLPAQNDTTCLTDAEVIKITNHIDSLVYEDSLKAKIIYEYKNQIAIYETLFMQDSIYISLKDEEIKLKDHQIQSYKELYEVTKPKWYNSRIIWFGIGAATIITSSWVVSITIP